MRNQPPFPAVAFVPLEGFDLIWRWTSPTRTMFTPEVLALVRPFTRSEALLRDAEAAKRAPNAYAPADVVRDCGGAVPGEEIVEWLEGFPLDPDTWTILSWNPATSVTVPWKIFATYWADFCYPASDDVTIWQPGEHWTLVFEHHESFRLFGVPALRAV